MKSFSKLFLLICLISVIGLISVLSRCESVEENKMVDIEDIYSYEESVIGSDGIGWQGVQQQYDRIKAAVIKEPKSEISVYQRSPSELWVYDSRPELGIGMHGIDDESLNMINKIGVRFVRTTLYWYAMEDSGTDGVYNKEYLAHWDKLVQTASRNNIELLVVVHGNLPGVSWENRYEFYKKFASFMGRMASRYPEVKYWELWNEMNVAFTDLFGMGRDGWQGYKGGKDYARMLKYAYPEIKKSNPSAFVSMGGLAWDWRDFLKGVYDAGGRDFFDIMNIHTYGMPVNWGFVNYAYHTRHIMRKYNDENKPIWNTEFGLDAGNIVNAWGFAHESGKSDGDYFDETQKAEWEKCIDEALATGLYQKYFPYVYSDGNELNVKDIDKTEYAANYLPLGMNINDYGFGMVRKDGKTPRPVYDLLLKEQYNSKILNAPIITDITIPYNGYVPEDYLYKIEEENLTIKGVKVGSITPVKIIMRQNDL